MLWVGWFGFNGGSALAANASAASAILATQFAAAAAGLAWITVEQWRFGKPSAVGVTLIPLSFTIILSMLPPSKHAMGLSGFAITATFAPAIGPAIGGYMNDPYGSPWVFYVNLVPGVLMFAALWYSLPKEPTQLGLLRRGDWRGIALMAIGLAARQTVLDDGNVDDWFGSPYIVKLSLIAGVALAAFVVLEFFTSEPVVNLRLASLWPVC